jgi:hypothetical protein
MPVEKPCKREIGSGSGWMGKQRNCSGGDWGIRGGCGPDIDASGLTYRCGMLLWSGSMVNQCCRKGGWVAERGGGNKYKHSTDRVNCIQFALA